MMPTKALFLLPILFLLYVAVSTDFFPKQWDAVMASILPLSDSRNAGPIKTKPEECGAIVAKFCKSKDVNGCKQIAVSAKCQETAFYQTGVQCGHPNAMLYDTEAACNAPRGAQSCPALLKEITAQDVPHIAQCELVHRDLCAQVCGARYDYMEIRNFIQTEGKPALLCMDGSLEPSKNGVLLQQDSNRRTCMEVHNGKASWCLNYNKTVNNVALGAFVACSGKISDLASPSP